MTELEDFRAQARSALVAGRIDEALAAFAAADEEARMLAPADPARIALAGEHGDAWFTHLGDPGRALAIATPVYEAAVDGIDDATEHAAAVSELATLRDQMIFWAFRVPD